VKSLVFIFMQHDISDVKFLHLTSLMEQNASHDSTAFSQIRLITSRGSPLK
jgi:hypothetical protein